MGARCCNNFFPAIHHVEQALFFKIKNPVLVEKPIGSLNNKSDELELLRERSKDSLVLVGYLLRHEPCLKVLDEMMKRKSRIGNILEADFYCGSWLPTWRKGKEYSQTVSANSNLGGGVLLELSHEIDLAHFLLMN